MSLYGVLTKLKTELAKLECLEIPEVDLGIPDGVMESGPYPFGGIECPQTLPEYDGHQATFATAKKAIFNFLWVTRKDKYTSGEEPYEKLLNVIDEVPTKLEEENHPATGSFITGTGAKFRVHVIETKHQFYPRDQVIAALFVLEASQYG